MNLALSPYKKRYLKDLNESEPFRYSTHKSHLCDRVKPTMNGFPRREVILGLGCKNQIIPLQKTKRRYEGEVKKASSPARAISLLVMIAALYAVTTVVLAPLSYQAIQVRISEILTPLPFYFGLPGVVGLIVGCLVANVVSPYGIYDIILGTMGTVCGALVSWKAPKLWMACLAPVISNAVWVGLLLTIYDVPFWFGAVTVGIGELIAVIVLGYPVMKALERFIPTMMFRERKQE